MANRHTHKKLRAEIRARIKTTGESYQQARARILSHTTLRNAPRVDLVPFSYFGLPGTLASFETEGAAMFAFVPSSRSWRRGYPHSFPLPFLRGVSRRGCIQ